MERTIGIDLDNTMISYDDLFHRVATSERLIDPSTPKCKKTIRDRVHELPCGETAWQKLQALVYGPMANHAKLMDGVVGFLEECFKSGVPVFIISHKTEFAGYDDFGTNLRSAAIDCLHRKGILDRDRFGLDFGRIFFESTRKEKVERIGKLNCTLFIDDLLETFLESSFPSGVGKILFANPQDAYENLPKEVVAFDSWRSITRYLFHSG